MKRGELLERADAFVEAHRGFVAAIVHRVVNELSLPRAELHDFMAYGFEGLLEARCRFDPGRGVSFKTFASYRVRGAVIDGVRKMSRVSHRVLARLRAMEAADLIAEDVASLRVGARPGTASTVAALDTALGRLSASYVLANVEATGPGCSPEESSIQTQTIARLHAALDGLDVREREIIVAYYFRDVPFERTARALGLSKSWVSRIYTRALDKLRASMDEAGETR